MFGVYCAVMPSKDGKHSNTIELLLYWTTSDLYHAYMVDQNTIGKTNNTFIYSTVFLGSVRWLSSSSLTSHLNFTFVHILSIVRWEHNSRRDYEWTVQNIECRLKSLKINDRWPINCFARALTHTVSGSNTPYSFVYSFRRIFLVDLPFSRVTVYERFWNLMFCGCSVKAIVLMSNRLYCVRCSFYSKVQSHHSNDRAQKFIRDADV